MTFGQDAIYYKPHLDTQLRPHSSSLYTLYSFIIISLLCLALAHKHIDWGDCSFERANLYLLTYI